MSIYESAQDNFRKSARSFSNKRSDNSIKSSSSFPDKPNSIISEEDSAFGEQTPAVKNNDAAKDKKNMTFNAMVEDHSAKKDRH